MYQRGHGESVFTSASTLVRRGEYRAQTGIWRLLGFVSVRTIKGRSSPPVAPPRHGDVMWRARTRPRKQVRISAGPLRIAGPRRVRPSPRPAATGHAARRAWRRVPSADVGLLNCRRQMAMNATLPALQNCIISKNATGSHCPVISRCPGRVGANVLRFLSDLGWVSSSRIAAAAPEPQRNLRRAQGGGLRHNRFEAARTTLSWTTLDLGRPAPKTTAHLATATAVT